MGPVFTGHELECIWSTEWGAALYTGGVSVGEGVFITEQNFGHLEKFTSGGLF